MASVNSTSTANTSSSKGSKDGSSGSPGVPKPMPMAIMRNAHEVIRGAMQDIQEMLDQDDFENARKLWHELHRFTDLHMAMEEGRKGCNARGIFKLVDEHADDAAKKGKLRHSHETLYELEEDVVDIFEKAPDMDRAKDIFPIFRKENEAHLTEEEDILMPSIQKMMKQGLPIKQYIKTDILPVLTMKEDKHDLEFFIRFANQVLERHDNVDGKPRVRVFDHGLWALATAEEWKVWSVWIKESLSPEKYAEVEGVIEAFEQEQEAKKAAKEAPPVESVNLRGKSPVRSKSPKRDTKSKSPKRSSSPPKSFLGKMFGMGKAAAS